MSLLPSLLPPLTSRNGVSKDESSKMAAGSEWWMTIINEAGLNHFRSTRTIIWIGLRQTTSKIHSLERWGIVVITRNHHPAGITPVSFPFLTGHKIDGENAGHVQLLLGAWALLKCTLPHAQASNFAPKIDFAALIWNAYMLTCCWHTWNLNLFLWTIDSSNVPSNKASEPKTETICMTWV